MGGDDKGWRLALPVLAWLAGMGVQLHEPALQPHTVYAAAMAAGGLGLAIAWRWRRAYALAVFGMAALAYGWAGERAALRLSLELPAQLEGQEMEVVGVVASLPQRSANGLRFQFDVEQARRAGQPVTVPERLALGWYGGFHQEAVLSPAQRALRAGQRWRFTLTLRRPHGLLNPHGFDYELLLFEQGVRATGYVREAPAPQQIDPAAGHVVERVRQAMRDAIEAAVPDGRAAGVLAALSVGDQSAIDREDWDLFRQTGIAHLVSISGLHVTMFAWIAGLAIATLWRRSPRALLVMPAPDAARWSGLLAAAAYAVFSGWGVPAQRTVWMLATVTGLQALGRRWPWPLVLLSAAGVVSLLDPWALLQPGFWLSFMAVGLLMASSSTPTAAPDAPTSAWGRAAAQLRQVLRTQAVATVGLTPLTLVFFQQVSVVGFLANLAAIPLVTLVITPLALLGALAPPLWPVGAWVVQRMVQGLGRLAAWPGAVWTVPVAPAWAHVCGLLAAALAVLPLPWRVRALAVPLVLPLLIPGVERPAEGRYEVLAADVGQGTAVLVRTARHLLVYDAGPRYSADSDAGQRVLLPLLRSLGEQRIDRLVLTHRDVDHVGGAKALLEGMPVGDLHSSLEEGHPLRALAGTHVRCEDGQSWQWDGVRFDMLQPPALAFNSRLRPNALSCVLRVSSAQGSMLFTGDIERPQEEWLVARYGAALRSDVLLVPHHGSKTSSSDAFLDAVAPREAVVQAGYRNRFGHPAPEVVSRLREHGIAVVDSASCGAWRSTGAGQGACERDMARRYWHHGSSATASVHEPAD
jgi:competence protein ComEC